MLKSALQTFWQLLLWTSLAGAAAPAEIVTSFSIVDDWTARLVGAQLRHQSLVPPASELHGYQLGATEAKALARARLIIGLSPASEPWLADWVQANGRTADTLWLQSTENGGSGLEPHPWTDPVLVVILVERLGQGIQRKFTTVKTEASVRQYVNEIKQLDRDLAASFAQVPAPARGMLTQHPNLGRFAQRYQLQVLGTILESPSAEAADPSARHYSDLLHLIRRQKVRTVITDEGQNDAIARRLCEDARVPPPVGLNFESLAPAGQPGDTWLGMMRHQSAKLREALLRP